MSRRVEEKDIKMLKFSFTNVGTIVCMRTFDMTANVYLGGILLETFEHKSKSKIFYKMLQVLNYY